MVLDTLPQIVQKDLLEKISHNASTAVVMATCLGIVPVETVMIENAEEEDVCEGVVVGIEEDVEVLRLMSFKMVQQTYRTMFRSFHHCHYIL